MKIKSLELTNFGQHSHLNIELDEETTVGILGKNGSGKSTVLTALEYAFTGVTKDNIQSYIKQGESSASVKCVFEKDGKVGTIKRTITPKTTSRSLIYGDNKPVTSAVEFDKLVEHIMGVDKQSIASTIFVAQGEIAKVLSPRFSERLAFFTKFLNLNYISKAINAVENVVQKLRDKVVDINKLRELKGLKEEELKTRQNNFVESTKAVVERFLSKEFIEDFKTRFRDFLALRSEHQAKLEETNKIVNTLASLKSDINAMSEGKDVDKFIEDLKNNKATYNATIQSLISKKTKLESSKDALDYLKKFVKSKNRLAYIDKFIFKDLPIDKIKEQISLSKEIKELDVKSSSYKATIEGLQKELIEASESIAAYEQDLPNKEKAVADLEQTKINLHTTLSQLTTLEETKKRIQSKIDKDTAMCPACGLKLMLGQKIVDEDINKVTESISFITAQLSEETLKLSEATENLTQLKLALEGRKRALTEAKSKKNEAEKLLEQIESLLSSKRALVDTSITDAIDLSNETLPSFIAEAEACAKDINDPHTLKYVGSCIELLGDQWESIQENDIIQKIQVIGSDINTLTVKVSLIDADLQKLADLNAKYSTYSKLLVALNNASMDIQGRLAEHPFKLVKTDYKLEEHPRVLDTFKDCLDMSILPGLFKEATELFNTLDAEAIGIKELKSQIEKEEESICKLEKDNGKLYHKIDELTKIKQLLQPNGGITLEYVEYLFTIVSCVVSTYLSLMKANFIVLPEDRPEYEKLSFKFQRIDSEDNEDVWFPMSKLSGGQAIKLAIAFQLAVQQIICPNISFLVLDEPSTHLDEDSVNALANLMSSIQAIFQGRSGQVWLVDHNWIFKQAIEKAIEL